MSRSDTYLTQSGPVHPGAPTPLDARPRRSTPGRRASRRGTSFAIRGRFSPIRNLTRADKRAILASWASDACALENAPGLRCLAGARAEPVSVDAVLAALTRLDAGTAAPPKREPRRRPHGVTHLHRSLRPRRKDDDDDPPPCPAMAMPRPRTPPGAAALGSASRPENRSPDRPARRTRQAGRRRSRRPALKPAVRDRSARRRGRSGFASSICPAMKCATSARPRSARCAMKRARRDTVAARGLPARQHARSHERPVQPAPADAHLLTSLSS